jgi:hypothetical protein
MLQKPKKACNRKAVSHQHSAFSQSFLAAFAHLIPSNGLGAGGVSGRQSLVISS